MSDSLCIFLKSITVPRLGNLQLAASEKGICAIVLPDFKDHDLQLAKWERAGYHIAPGNHPFLSQASDELRQYCKQQRTTFKVPVDLRFLTPFTQHVLTTLHKLPFATCITYGALAARAGNPAGARAVGGAVGRNPVPVIIPCHRIVASCGIGGFGLGLPCKRALLAIEKVDRY